MFFLEEGSKDEKKLLTGLIFVMLTQWLSTMMRKDFQLIVSVFIFSTICLESGNAELSFPKKLFENPKTVLTTLYLFFRSWWQIFVLHNARSQLLEVIFLLVQTEAQYNLDTINNIFTVGVVKWGSRIFICDVETLKRECYIWILVFSSSFTKRYWEFSSWHKFSDESGFSRSWRCGRCEEKKDAELFSPFS